MFSSALSPLQMDHVARSSGGLQVLEFMFSHLKSLMGMVAYLIIVLVLSLLHLTLNVIKKGWMLTIVILMVIETIDLFQNRLSFFARVIDFLCWSCLVLKCKVEPWLKYCNWQIDCHIKLYWVLPIIWQIVSIHLV